jgi:hypothetical protein
MGRGAPIRYGFLPQERQETGREARPGVEPHRASLDPRTFLGGPFTNLSRERLLSEAAATGFRPSMMIAGLPEEACLE